MVIVLVLGVAFAVWFLRAVQGPAGGYAVAGAARRLRRVLGGRPAAARRAVSAWRASNAARMRWLRVTSRHVARNMRGVRPARRHQPRAMLVVAVSFMLALAR